MQEVNVLLQILDKYGFDTAQLALTGFLFWKLFTNHLAHIQKAIEENVKAVEEVKKDTNEIKKDISDTKQRVSNIEGRCTAFHGDNY